jgi:hypothetical protein
MLAHLPQLLLVLFLPVVEQAVLVLPVVNVLLAAGLLLVPPC